ncbi:MULTISPECIES: DUF3800 domain-containing protein [Rhizobium/Agrobacterium group]|uniref:DUF3800 domain-containing protein n=1 Tax=Rhizobium/Agrobacterium group TaxID=227290 RepID=UPI000B3FE386|nr:MULTISPECIES: DUF3800 domain-containing protein [Rhizobium/Agrobacterium group]MCF1482230.1 DUF3800 domain-containing protein [Allorhizobium ampelinum]NSZ41992.1 DUF3800 domain-containing protein [Agrobacterium vitis]NTA25701.1 DUF3800 domain-containing protein [Allorhizobium ampelinum]OVE96390.1 hypothetical protein B7W85_04220 [Allorhizobium ampelinum]
MWAYVDETGNTLNNLFDEDQPLFVTAAFITKTNFDLVAKSSIAAIAKKVDLDALHANVLGVAKIEQIAPDLLKLLKKTDCRFFISRVEKKYLAACKVIDVYFDQGENKAVPWSAYWLRHLRLLLTFKMASFVITPEIAAIVWDCVTAKSEFTSKKHFVLGAEAMLDNVQFVPDVRSRQIITDALVWAIANPEEFSTHMSEKALRYQHSPNFVAFVNLLDGLQNASERWKRPVREIVHDKQAEVEKVFATWHATISKPELAKAEGLSWPGESKAFKVQKVTGSTFRTATEEESAGLQVVDVVLWCFKRIFSDKEIGQEAAKLLNWVMQRAYQNDFSFEGVGMQVEAELGRIMDADMSKEQLAEGRKLMAEMEAQRKALVAAHAINQARKLTERIAT